MSLIKKCIGCECEFDESEISYRIDYCERCGSKLEIKEEEEVSPTTSGEYSDIWTTITTEPVSHIPTTSIVNEKVLGDILTIDSLGYIHIIEESYNNEINYADQSLQIFINDKLINSEPIIYDETTIGRNSISFNPDIDLGKIDPEKMVSRKHAMIYRENGKYYLRNLSSKNTLHLNEDPIAQEESKELNNGDLIIFSNYIIAKFIKSTY